MLKAIVVVYNLLIRLTFMKRIFILMMLFPSLFALFILFALVFSLTLLSVQQYLVVYHKIRMRELHFPKILQFLSLIQLIKKKATQKNTRVKKNHLKTP